MSSPDDSTWNTQAVRAWDQPQLQNSADLPITTLKAEFAFGLNELDIDKSHNIRVKAYGDNVTPNSVRVHLDAWADTILYSAGLTKLEIANIDRDFQIGTFATTDDHPWDKPQQATSRKIQFAKSYAAPPKITVWLNQLDIDSTHNWRVKAYASDITATDFTLHIDTWGDTILYSASATWIASPANRPNIQIGAYSTSDIRPWDKPQQVNAGNLKFPAPFERVPRVLVAFNQLDVGNGANLRVRTNTSNVTAQGLSWNIDSWADTTLYSATVAYLAIQDF